MTSGLVNPPISSSSSTGGAGAEEDSLRGADAQRALPVVAVDLFLLKTFDEERNDGLEAVEGEGVVLDDIFVIDASKLGEASEENSASERAFAGRGRGNYHEDDGRHEACSVLSR